jgi:hypothetical protein
MEGRRATKLAVQDLQHATTYLLDTGQLDQYRLDETDDAAADVLFVMPSQLLVEEVPALCSAESAEPSVLICDPDHDRRWLLAHADLTNFAVRPGTEPADADMGFSMPEASGLLEAVPFFRRALVQNSS